MELPELLNLDFDKIKKKIIYGTDLERAEKEDDFKVAIFCCNVPSHVRFSVFRDEILISVRYHCHWSPFFHFSHFNRHCPHG